MKKPPFQVFHQYYAIQEQWDPVENIQPFPDDPVKNKDVVGRWKCEKGYFWYETIENRAHYRICHACHTPGRVTEIYNLEYLRPDIIKEWHPTKNKGITPDEVTPLAAFGNGWTFQDKLAQVKDIKLKNKLLIYIAYSMLTGLRNMHDDGISHLDVKPTNFLLHTDGTVYVSDFGCAQQKDNLKGGIGDFSYFSPERLAHIRFLEQQQGREYHVKEISSFFSGKAADAWAAGITLLEIANNAYPFDCNTDVIGMLNGWDKSYYERALSEAFAQARQVAILPILQRLLAIDPQERWNTTQAQGAIAKSLSQESSTVLFDMLEDETLFGGGSYNPMDVVNNNNLYAKKEGIYSPSRDKSATSAFYGAQLSSYYLMQQAYDEETPLLNSSNNNNSQPLFVPMYN